jgi:peptidoglycan/LPS O-acetylase OafA/YrhL
VRSGGTSFGYVPALDGVRALAVVAVLLFYAELGWVGVHGSVRPHGVHPDIVVLTELARVSLVDLLLAAASTD